MSLTNRKTCRINRMSLKFQGSVACKRRFEFHPVAKWHRGYKRFFSCLTELCRKFILLMNVKMPTVGILTIIRRIITSPERFKEKITLLFI